MCDGRRDPIVNNCSLVLKGLSGRSTHSLQEEAEPRAQSIPIQQCCVSEIQMQLVEANCISFCKDVKERLLGSCAPSTTAHHLLPPAGWSLVRARSCTGDKSEQAFTSESCSTALAHIIGFVRVAIRKYHKLGGLTTETIFFSLHRSGGWMCKFTESAGPPSF